ncbi:hypothetical protein EK21DRAFT_32843, partial [Setomelanomma holmii]
HHHYCTSANPSPLPTPAASKTEAPQPTHHHLNHVDRDSAIALGSIVLLIFAVMAWYVYSRLKERRQASLERLVEEQRRDSLRRASVMRDNEVGIRDIGFRMNSLWSKRSRQDSGATVVGSDNGRERGGGKKKSWPEFVDSRSSSSVATRVGSVDEGLAPHALDECPFHPRDRERWLSPHSRSASVSNYTPAPPSPSARKKSSHRRTSSIHGLPADVLVETRRASLSQAQEEKKWWEDVAKRGSSSHADRRFSVLEPIPEPIPEPGVAGDNREDAGQTGKTDDGNKTRSKSLQVAYDWTRPSV